MIHYFNIDTNYVLRHKRIISSWINSVILSKYKQLGSINIIFTSDSELLKMNNLYLSHNYKTDVLTFDTSSYGDDFDEPVDVSSNDCISGDIFISVDTVKYNAKYYEQNVTSEMYRVIIHGVLHLLGYNDHSDNEKIAMTEQENLALSKLSFNE